MAKSNFIARCTDVAEEPTTTLTPIEGYEKKPLMSFREAVALIKTEEPIHNLEKMVWAAERNAENPLDGLTSAESASIYLYTMEWPEQHIGFCTLLNEKLRSEKRNDLKSWFSYLNLFLTALNKLPSLKKVIWRGIKGDVRHLYKKDFIWWGASSCTETMSVIEGFIGRSGVRTIFLIECINGKAIKNHSFHKTENEIILMPGTYLRVIDKWSPADNLYMIHLQEEIPPYPLVASLKNHSNHQDVATQTDGKCFSTFSQFLRRYYTLEYLL